ncbi:MAG TPA: hypothetical protein VFZ41_10985, partial [Solirubrobacterales bacterium]
VTHQKRTMDAADVLYGVTMGGDGVTRVVSRRLPREEGEEGEQPAASQQEGPPPFAGIAGEEDAGDGLAAPAVPRPSGEAEAA